MVVLISSFNLLGEKMKFFLICPAMSLLLGSVVVIYRMDKNDGIKTHVWRDGKFRTFHGCLYNVHKKNLPWSVSLSVSK